MAQSVRLDRLDFIDVQVKFGRLRRYILRDFAQLGPTAADDGARAGALWRTVILAQTSLVIQFGAAEFERRHVLQRDVLDASRAGTARRARAQFLFLLA